MSDPRIRRFVLAHCLTVIGEWAVTVAVLVHAYRWGGSGAVGLVSLAVLAPPLVFAPVAANLTARHRAHRVRLAGFALQALAYSGAAIAATLDAPTPAVAAFAVVGLGAINTLRPTGAVLLPAVVRTTRELTTANLRVSYCDSSSALIGPLLAAALTGAGGSELVFAACAGASAISFAATAWRPAPMAVTRSGHASTPRRVMRVALAELRSRPWTLGVLGVSAARNLVVGAFDVLLVIMALDALDLGEGGPGILTALVGAGALISTVVVTVVVRRAHLRPALTISLVTTATMCVALGLAAGPAMVYLVLPVLGVCLSMMDNLSRMLLQRSTDPRHLGPLFAVLGLVGGLGQLVGSAIAQLMLAVAGLDAALIGLAVVLASMAVAGLRSLRSADDHAEVPVVEMSLLVGLPMFRPLPAVLLEAVARSAGRLEVGDGTRVITQGDAGDTFYAVSDGAFDVVMSGRFVRTAGRGDFFGEVALLADVARTATVTARGNGVLLTIDRDPFLVAVTGHEAAQAAAAAHIGGLRLDDGMLPAGHDNHDNHDRHAGPSAGT